MFALLTKKNAASRVFCYQLVPYLQSAGIQVQVFPPSPVWVFELMCESVRVPVLRTALKAAYWYGVVPLVRLFQVARCMGSDVVFIQRGMWRYNSGPVIERLTACAARRTGRGRVIYHYDDANYLHANPRHFHRRFEIADLVLTGNERLAEYARAYNPNTVLWEGCVDVEHFHPATREMSNATVIIGWAGTDPEHARELVDVVAHLRRRFDVRLRIVGPPGARPFRAAGVEYVRWTFAGEVRDLQSFDIGVMPLRDTEFNRAKEGYKLKQYMAVGIPVVASPIGKNVDLVRDGITGFLAHSRADWEEALARLIEDGELRRRMGKAGRLFVEEHYSIAVQGPRLVALLRTLLAENQQGPSASE